MASDSTKLRQQPILEWWRILALALIVAAGMLFVRLIVPAEAAASATVAGLAQVADR
jgi:hypothetical protein